MQSKFINALSYFSILFAPVLIPIIIWFAAGDFDVKRNAKKALFLQIVPTVAGILAIIFIGITGLSTNDSSVTGWIAIIVFGILGLISVVTYIYDLVLGVKALLAE
ncbi:DUF4870 domain-containing protein [Periweissella fabaria]|uniref:DUF4870 domain-containing protein n=1 Tax=Periweissella fabaria TaxID=546157 RepID=A0ABN8BMQ7_9LACO|nr:DUF4870 domain-containing protein [Periweissella fabaria]MCM0597716.1 DUF4870 domain-containing protein [Periweissella fabaria]CAH0417165.1 hypothetical protein WFA24289_01494 [Periweissella fabaria]